MPNRFVTPYFVPLGSNGTTIPLSKLYFYQSLSLVNPLDTYSDAGLTSPNPHPVVADADGVFPAIFLQEADYNVLFKTKDDVEIWSADPVSGVLDVRGNEFQPAAQDPVDMTITVSAGTILNRVTSALVVKAVQTTPLFIAPVSFPRIDLVVIDPLTAVISVVAGSESATPVAPAIPANKLPVAQLAFVVAQTSITVNNVTDIRELDLMGAGDVTSHNTGADAGEIGLNDEAFEDVASATETDIGAAGSRNVRVTGTTTITGLGTVASGIRRTIRFADALILTHNATSLILIGSADITTVANDTAEFISLGSGNWLCLGYNRISGQSVSFETFTSAEQVITNGGLITIAHGLSAMPTRIRLFFKCITAEGGYSVGQLVPMPFNAMTRGSTTNTVRNSGVAIVPDATNIRWRVGSDGVVMLNWDTGGHFYANSVNWKIIVEADIL